MKLINKSLYIQDSSSAVQLLEAGPSKNKSITSHHTCSAIIVFTGPFNVIYATSMGIGHLNVGLKIILVVN